MSDVISLVKAELKELAEISNDAAAPGRGAEETCYAIHLNLLDVMFRLERAIEQSGDSHE